jgi:hypothetical protein
MPYEHIEEILSRKSEKIALFLTVENAIGLIVAALPAYLLSQGLPFVLRILVVGAAALLGIVATLDVGGLTLFERIVWRVRGMLRMRVSGDTITPDQLSGGSSVRRERPLAVDGPIRLRRNTVASRRRLTGNTTPRLAESQHPSFHPDAASTQHHPDSNKD